MDTPKLNRKSQKPENGTTIWVLELVVKATPFEYEFESTVKFCNCGKTTVVLFEIDSE